MAKYWLIIKLVWIEKMTYRVNVCLEIVSSVVSSVILVCLWLAVYRSSSSSAIGEYSLADMVTYLLVGGVINNFLLSSAGNTEISQSIHDGTLSSLLLKPLRPHGLWLFRDIGSKSFERGARHLGGRPRQRLQREVPRLTLGGCRGDADGTPTPNLDAFLAVARRLQDGAEVQLIFRNCASTSKSQVARFTLDLSFEELHAYRLDPARRTWVEEPAAQTAAAGAGAVTRDATIAGASRQGSER